MSLQKIPQQVSAAVYCFPRMSACRSKSTLAAKRIRIASVASGANAARPEMLVSSPHPISHIRLIRFPATSDSTLPALEVAFLRRREAAQMWNHEFWTENNLHFQREKADYEAEIHRTHNRPATANELSIFYKQYLDNSLERHSEYNRAWWKENTRMLLPALQAEMSALRRTVGLGDIERWWRKVGHTIVRIGGGYTAQGVTFR
ncbi:uncharacterized protein EV422DRAFT_525973 [Fimicolochytrium jonesii]|uniref:uncharacterized protein n=1 Tax=Fimicolochytrium jonesii TaxID=1396493 RepID=UPI0022FE8B06|nr:uncharacterized protein EV422DRAFT_525973 [Fimicolochytrium jonesii]KAI8822182.1 hypothetical protein EV422DRAFT_525973 [Fimicolochytrium jonesii]